MVPAFYKLAHVNFCEGSVIVFSENVNDSGCPLWLEKLDNEPFSIIWLETIGFSPALAGKAGIFLDLIIIGSIF